MHVSKIPVFWPVNSSIRARSRSTRRRGNGSQQSLLRTFRAAHVRRRDSCSIGPGDWAVPWVCRFQIPCIGACAKSKDFPPADRGGGDMRPEQGEEAAATQSPKNKRQYSACAERGNHRHMVTISITVWTLRARGAARDRRPGSGTATGRGKAAHYAIILLSSVWVSNTRLRGRPSSFDVVSKRLKRFTARGGPGRAAESEPRVSVYCAYTFRFIGHFKLYELPLPAIALVNGTGRGRGAPPAPRRRPDVNASTRCRRTRLRKRRRRNEAPPLTAKQNQKAR